MNSLSSRENIKVETSRITGGSVGRLTDENFEIQSWYVRV
jgi:hypothetical protein